MEDKKKLYLKIGGAVAALGLIYVLAFVAIPKALVTFTKAAPATVISLGDSRVLGQKILAKADGADKCIVNVFIMDKSGKGVEGKEVTLAGAESITPISVKSNSDGKATFSITSSIEGQYTLTASVGGSPLPTEIKVTFRN